MWGWSNKEAPLRLSEDYSNFEVKLLDGASNPYFALAGVLLAGLHGVRKGLKLESPCQANPPDMPEESRPRRLPASLRESLEVFQEEVSKGSLQEVFHGELLNDLVCVKRAEIKHVENVGLKAYQDMMVRKLCILMDEGADCVHQLAVGQ